MQSFHHRKKRSILKFNKVSASLMENQILCDSLYLEQKMVDMESDC